VIIAAYDGATIVTFSLVSSGCALHQNLAVVSSPADLAIAATISLLTYGFSSI